MRRFLISVLCLCCFFAAGVNVYAGMESDGSQSDPVDLPKITDMDQAEDTAGLTYTQIQMEPGLSYDISKNSGATWMVASKSGEYRISGNSERTLFLLHADKGVDIKIIFCGTNAKATASCPGDPAKARSVITIEGEPGGKVTIMSAEGTVNNLTGKGGVPAIRKDTVDVETVFATENENDPGTLVVRADSSATKTSAIGCYSNLFTHKTFGNVTFKSGNVKAYGSENGFLGGGPGIGADNYGSVDGVTFENANVEAVAGSGSSAAIGTASSFVFVPFSPNPNALGDEPEVGERPEPTEVGDRVMGVVCQNINIKGGTVKALHDKNVDDMEQNGGAGIGGGWGCHSDKIFISGGDVTAEGTMSAAGIGGGNEGNCNGYDFAYRPCGYDGSDHGIVISGGKVKATGGATGIGSGFAQGETGEVDKFRFGDCRVEITGGEVTAIATEGPAIGGYKEEEYKPVMKVIISGGKVDATGRTGIGPGGVLGVMREINISGGIVHAKGTSAVGTAIGTQDIQNHKNIKSYCRTINITGGTIWTEVQGKEGPGLICGYKDLDETTDVYISGGNVYGVVENGEARRSRDDHSVVKVNEIEIQGYGLNRDLRLRDDIKIEEIGVSGSDLEYGVNDAYLFASEYDHDTVMYIWLPEQVSVSSAKTDPAFLTKGLKLKDENVTEFSGITTAAKGGMLYPGFWFFIDDNYYKLDQTELCAFARIGDTEAQDFHGITVETIRPAAYTVDKERKIPLLYGDGTFAKASSDSKTAWTDDKGRLLMAAITPPNGNARDAQNNYLNGIPLYSVWTDFALYFESNKPKAATTSISGDMPCTVNKYDDPLAIPKCGFTLPDYRFKGWALVAEPGASDPIYKPGTSVMPDQLDAKRTGKITLYAQWEIQKFTVTFDTGEGSDVDDQIVIIHQKAEEPDDPERDGYKFAGWYKDEKFKTKYNFDSEVTEDITLYAKWDKKGHGTATGDSTPLGLAAAVALIALIGLGVTWRRRKK